MRAISWLVAGILLCTLFIPFAYGEESQPSSPTIEWIRLITPAENAQVIAKKPEVRAEFPEPFPVQTLIVILDGTDITQLLAVSDKGFVYNPFMVLNAGSHSLSISVTDKEGRQLQKNYSFTTRHSVPFEEAYSSNEASFIYETILSEPDKYPQIPDSKVEGNLRSDSEDQEKAHGSLHSIQMLGILTRTFLCSMPRKKGCDVANWIFNGSYSKDNLGT